MIYVNLFVILAMMALLFLFRKYNRRRLKESYHPKGFYALTYPLACRLYHGILKRPAASEKATLKKLHPVENTGQLLEKKYLNNISLAILIFIIINLASASLCLSERNNPEIIDGKFIQRNTYGGGNRQLDLTAVADAKKEQITVDVGEKRYSSDELKQLKERCNTYIRMHVLGDNPELSQILAPLNFFSDIPGESVTVQWQVSDYSLIGISGNIYNDSLESPAEVTVTAQCSYFDQLWDCPLLLTVLPPEADASTRLDSQLQDALLAQEQKTIHNDYLELPQTVDGVEIFWMENAPSKAGWIWVLGLVLIISLFAREREQQKKQLKLRDRQLTMEYPVFVHKVVLLLNAGMTAKGAWQKIVTDYEKSLPLKGERKYVYEEMRVAALEMQKGVTEISAYEDFGRRCGQNQYLKFSSILIQSVRTGAKGLGRMLNDAADEAVLLRQEAARRLGEEAGTRLLFPMVILLAVVMFVLMIPAFMSMNF